MWRQNIGGLLCNQEYLTWLLNRIQSKFSLCFWFGPTDPSDLPALRWCHCLSAPSRWQFADCAGCSGWRYSKTRCLAAAKLSETADVSAESTKNIKLPALRELNSSGWQQWKNKTKQKTHTLLVFRGVDASTSFVGQSGEAKASGGGLHVSLQLPEVPAIHAQFGTHGISEGWGCGPELILHAF